MPEDLRIRVGLVVATVPIGGTPLQIGNAIRRFMRRMGIAVTGNDEQDLVAFLTHWRDETRRIAKDTQIAEADATAHAANVIQAETDNPL